MNKKIKWPKGLTKLSVFGLIVLWGFIGYAIGKKSKTHWPCCGGDEKVKSCLKQPGFAKHEHHHESMSSNDPNECYHICPSEYPNCNDTNGNAVSVQADSAQIFVRQFGHWAGKTAVGLEKYYQEQNERSLTPIISTPIELTGVWTIPLIELMNDMAGAEYMRAYLVIKDTIAEPHGTPKIEMIFARVGPDGRDEEYDCYHNLVRPCPNTCGANGNDILYNEYIIGDSLGRLQASNRHIPPVAY